MTDTQDNIPATKKTFYHEMHFTFECNSQEILAIKEQIEVMELNYDLD